MTKHLVYFLSLSFASALTACSPFKTPEAGGHLGGGLGAHEKCGDTVTLSWTPPTHNTDGSLLTDLAGYKVYYGLQSRTYSTTIDTNDMTQNGRDVTGLSPNKYYFTVTAYNSNNVESDYANEGYITLINCPVKVRTAHVTRLNGVVLLTLMSH
jgi:hypothetical protein